ncbi:RluA family pseudouridine synthase [Zavarzinia sp. CC-PAN008]|uniref:RluA family pseudouridine synthase n=1 Tax=Zavarzinia sp. CC-PAN008 TaxID=3243332 RepID=UPI003F743D57
MTPDRAGDRLDKVLANALPDLSRARLKSLIEAGAVSTEGATIREPARPVKPGQVVMVRVQPDVEASPQAQEIPLDVVYEDMDLIVVNKQPGLVVHPAPGSPDMTLVNALLAHCGDSLSGIGGVKRPGIVHRLDKDTSGLMVAAKSDAAHAGLSAMFAAHDMDRGYRAVTWGVPSPPQGRIDGAIGRNPHDRQRMAIVSRGGKDAVTHYAVEQRFGLAAALVGCRLETGRTHQIRVHLASRGHGLVGDPLYGRAPRGARAQLPSLAVGFPRQALHAWLLGFRHPVTGRNLRFEADIPGDMKDLLRALGYHTSG